MNCSARAPLALAALGLLLGLLPGCGGGDAAPPSGEASAEAEAPVIAEEEPIVPDAKEFMGVWVIGDVPEQRFDLVVLPNGTALSTYMEGDNGVRGEFGRWQHEDDRLIITFDSGWRDVLSRQENGYTKQSYAPDIELTDEASNTGVAEEFFGPKLPFIGVWQGNDHNGAPLFFMALASDGSGRKSNNLQAFADWVVFENAAKIAWTDGTYNELHPESRTEAILKVWRKDTPRDQDPDASFKIFMVQDATSQVPTPGEAGTPG
ncbi:MAG: hypothetical protein AAGK14_11010 [Verrucomicrobiota bacterium]